MIDNTTLNLGSGGDTLRTEDRTTYKTPVSLIDVGGVASEALIGDGTNAMPVRGLAAENAAVVGNPVLVGVRYDATPRTLGDGDVGAPAANASGHLIVDMGSNNDVTVTSGTITTVTTVTTCSTVTNLAQLGGQAVSMGTGARDAGTQRVTIATDDTVPVSNAGLTELAAAINTNRVDVNIAADGVSLATAANQSTIIGHVDGIEALLTTIDADTGSLDTKIAAYTTDDLDTGTGTDTVTVTGIALPGNGGHVVGGTSTNPVRTDPTGTTTQPVSAASLPLPTNAAIETGGNLATVAGDTTSLDGKFAAAATLADNMASPSTTQVGAMLMVYDGANWDMASGNSANGLYVSSAVAAGETDAGNPIKVGAWASASVSGDLLYTDNDRCNITAGLDGVLITRPHTNLEDVVAERDTNTDGNSTNFGTGLAAPGASVRLCITSVTIANSSSNFRTVDLRDGSAGSVLWTFPVPATGGVTHTFNPPLRLTANTALAYHASAATDTLYISAIGFKSRI